MHSLVSRSTLRPTTWQRFDQLNAAPDYTPKEEPEPVKKTTAKKTAAPRKVARK